MWMKYFLCLESSAVVGKPYSLSSSDTISPHTHSCLFPLTLLLLFKSWIFETSPALRYFADSFPNREHWFPRDWCLCFVLLRVSVQMSLFFFFAYLPELSVKCNKSMHGYFITFIPAFSPHIICHHMRWYIYIYIYISFASSYSFFIIALLEVLFSASHTFTLEDGWYSTWISRICERHLI